MDFLEAIEDKSGERLVSSVLKFLIVNSATFRQRLITKIRAVVPPGRAPTFRSGVVCQTEYPTEDENLGDGFIDVIVADGQLSQSAFVLAIEVKLWAAFTPNQPAKYSKTLRKMVKDDPLGFTVLVLVPKDRVRDVKQHIETQNTSANVWCWDDVREDLLMVKENEIGSVAMVVTWLLEYLDRHLGTMEIQGTPNLYVGKDVQIGNEFHRDFLYKLKSCFSSPGPLVASKTYVGFTCTAKASDGSERLPAPVWVGFANDKTGEAVFGIDSTLPRDATADCFWNDHKFFKIPFDAGLKTAIAWRDRILKTFDEIQKEFDNLPATDSRQALPSPMLSG